MDLRQLRYFTVLATQQHFGRAASVLHIAQPALTRQIKLLEEELGVRLFERHSRGATPTDEAKLLLERGAYVLRYVAQLKADISALQQTPRGTVAIGMSPALALTLVPRLTAIFQERYPDVRLQIVEGFTDSLEQLLLLGGLDLAVLNGPTSRPNLIAQPLVREKLCLIAPARPGASRRRGLIRINDLDGIPLVIVGVAKSGVRLQLEAAAARADVALNPVVEVQSLELAKTLVLQGIGSTVHFAASIQEDISAGLLSAVPIEGLSMLRFVARSSHRSPSPATTAVAQALRQLASDLIDARRWPNATLLNGRMPVGGEL